MQRGFLLLALCALIVAPSCAPKYTRYVQHYRSITSIQPDYKSLEYWAAHPDKYDPSDSIPSPLKSDYKQDSAIDVFFVHPTTFTGSKETSWNASLIDASLNAKTDYTTILYQASVFNEYRVFAPRYRQAHLRSYYSNSIDASAAFDTAYQDVKNAFTYFLNNLNKSHPFIIASHSQGTTHTMRLIKEMIDGKPLASKLVAAYLVGMYLPHDYFPSLAACQDSISVKCICAWRSFQFNYKPSYVNKEEITSSVVNPLSWRTNQDYVPKTMNTGSILRKFNSLYNGIADAKIEGGILWIQKPVFPGSVFLRMKNYHIADFNFFYVNIRQNVRQRVASYKEKANRS